jgi:hypothetical protein
MVIVLRWLAIGNLRIIVSKMVTLSEMTENHQLTRESGMISKDFEMTLSEEQLRQNYAMTMRHAWLSTQDSWTQCVKRLSQDRRPESLKLGSKKTMGLWLWSTKGSTGKTTWAEHKYPNAYDKMDNKWWEGYDDEEVIIWDDPNQKTAGKHLMGYIKKWCNEKPVHVEVKGGSKVIRFKHVIITANKSPEEFFGDRFEEAGPLTAGCSAALLLRICMCWAPAVRGLHALRACCRGVGPIYIRAPEAAALRQ